MSNLNARKTSIYIFTFLIILFACKAILLKTHFIQNKSDQDFDERLYRKLTLDTPLKASDLFDENWKSVCVLYAYETPDASIFPESYNKQLSEDYFLNSFELSPFLSKYDDSISWIFFVEESGKIKKVFRSQGKATLTPANSEIDKYFIEGKSYISLSFSKRRCSDREKAFFLQEKASRTPDRKYFVFIEKA